MRQIKKIILSLFLGAVMVMGGAGVALAAESETTAGNDDYEIRDPQLDKAMVASVDEFNVSYDPNNPKELNIYFSGYGKKFEIYVNNVLHRADDMNAIFTSEENPAPVRGYSGQYFGKVIPGASYTVKIIPYSYSINGDIAGTPVSKTVHTTPMEITSLNVDMGRKADESGYDRLYAVLSLSSALNFEIWRREGKGVWTKIGETDEDKYFYDYSVEPGKQYQYRVRTAAKANAYASMPAGKKWVTSKLKEAGKISDVDLAIDYMDNVTISMTPNNGLISGYEVWRSTKRTKGYKKIATIADNKYTDSKVKRGAYYYKVRAYYYDTATGKKYYGAFSDIEPIKLILGDMKVTIMQTGKSSAKLEWNKVTGADKYEVWYKSELPGDTWKLYKTTKGVSCKVSRLSNDARYSFRVKAIKGKGKNTYVVSKNISYSIGFKKPYLQVTKIKVASSALKDMLTIKSTIKWNRIYGASKIRVIGITDGHYENGSYVPKTETVLKTLKGTATSYTYTTAVTAEHKGYDSIKIVAVKGKEELSGTIYNTAYRRLNEVTKVTIKRKDDTSAVLSWNAVVGATSYDIYRLTPYMYEENSTIEDMGNVIGDRIATVEGTTYVDSAITPGVNYNYIVVPVNNMLHSQYMHYGSYIYARAVRRVPYNHKLGKANITGLNNSAAKTATVTWNSVAFANRYTVYRSTSRTGKYTKVATTSNTAFIDNKVIKGKTYYYKIKASGKNAAGITVTSYFSAVKEVKINK